MICSACKEDVHPVIAIGAPSAERTRGIMKKCPRCGAGMSDAEPVAAQPEQHAVSEDVATPPTRAPQVARPSKAQSTDVLTMARERLEFVRGRIAELRQFEAEEAMLVRMVEAASAPPLRAINS